MKIVNDIYIYIHDRRQMSQTNRNTNRRTVVRIDRHIIYIYTYRRKEEREMLQTDMYTKRQTETNVTDR